MHRAARDTERGLGDMDVSVAADAMAHLVNIANGDARVALNALETAAYATRPGDDGSRPIDIDTISDALQRRSPMYDKAGDNHYDTISAFIKSVRGSSPDGALYWLARMIESGEDPLFIARRLLILASEDIGLADPQALTVAVAAQQAVHFIGMPEGRIPLAEATVYLATAPKSNTAYAALNEAMADVRRLPNGPVPLHLRNAVTGLMQQMGYGKDYKYSHDFDGHFAAQDYLPPELDGKRYYHPGTEGAEKADRGAAPPLVGRRREPRGSGLRPRTGSAVSVPRQISAEIEDLAVAGRDQVLRRDHDLLPPHPCSHPQLVLQHQAGVDDRPEPLRLPVKGRYRPNLVPRHILHRLRVGQPYVPGPQRPLQPARDGVLVPAQHHQGPFPGPPSRRSGS